MFVLGPFVAALPFIVLARCTIPGRQSFLIEFQAFSAKLYSRSRGCGLCRGLSCRRCSRVGRIYTRVSSALDLVRYVEKDLYCLAEATNVHGDIFLFKGMFNCWKCLSVTPSRPERVHIMQKMQSEIDGYLSQDTQRLSIVWYLYLACVIYFVTSL